MEVLTPADPSEDHSKTLAEPHPEVIGEEVIDSSHDEELEAVKTLPTPIKYSYFVFVNPRSGGNKAAKLTELELQKMMFTATKGDPELEFFVYDITNPANRELGLTLLKKKQGKGRKNLHVIVGGGDGTVLWVIDEMVRAKIDFATCPIGVIPFGTGNDFSRVLGWGGTEPSHLIGTHLEGLKRLAQEWVHSTIEDFDIWDVTIETYDYGGLTHISKSKGTKFEKKYLTIVNPETKEETRAYTFKRKMSNYFSFGVDSRIGYDFDKRRTQSLLENKFVYAWEGAKQLFMKNVKINDILEEMNHLNDDDDDDDHKDKKEHGKDQEKSETQPQEELQKPVAESSPVKEEIREESKRPEDKVQKQVQEEIQKQAKEGEKDQTKEAQKQEEIVVVEEHPVDSKGLESQKSSGLVGEGFKMFPSASLRDKVESSGAKVSVIKGNHAVFLCLNIPSYMGGASDPWATSKGRVGVTDNAKANLPDFEDQNYGDSKLELIGFKRSHDLALERAVHGRGWRLGQVGGPFILNFKVSKDETKPLHNYMQIDGEFYDVIAPKSVRVSLSKDIPNGKIKVLKNPAHKKHKHFTHNNSHTSKE